MLKLAPGTITGFRAMGGWAVVTVKNLPEYFRRRTTIQRSHALFTRRTRTVEAGCAGAGHRWARRLGCSWSRRGAIGRGTYAVTFTAPPQDRCNSRSGAGWQQPAASLSADCGRRGGSRPALAARDRGQMLFVARDATLHVKQRSDRPSENQAITVGPELGGRPFGPRIRRPESEESGVNRTCRISIERCRSCCDRVFRAETPPRQAGARRSQPRGE